MSTMSTMSTMTSEQLNIPPAWVDNVVRCLYDAAERASKEGDAVVGRSRGGITVRMEGEGEGAVITVGGVGTIPGFRVDEFLLVVDSPHNCRGHLRDLLTRRRDELAWREAHPAPSGPFSADIDIA